MSTLLAHAVAVVVYAVASWLIRLALTVVTMPLVTVQALVHSRPGRGVLRVAVGSACGFGAMLVCQRILGELGHGRSAALVVVVGAAIAAFYLATGWPFRATPQFTDDMLSVAGEEIGAVAAALFVLLRPVTMMPS